jgi:hypothetical protein
MPFNHRIALKDFDIPIFKFIAFEYVAAMLKNNELLVGQTMQWEDVYENFLLKCGPEQEVKKYLPVFYGQCWTFRKETDALWRIYSPTKHSVRIKTTIRKLLGISDRYRSKSPSIANAAIGPVRYFQPSQFRKWMSAEKRQNLTNDVLADSLFIKRTEFSHESEMRLIFQRQITDSQKHPRFVKIPFDPNHLLDEIAFDPRVNKDTVEVNSHILRTLGFRNRITRSTLYDFEPMKLRPGRVSPAVKEG